MMWLRKAAKILFVPHVSFRTHNAAPHLRSRQFLSSSFCPLLPTLTATTSSKDTSRGPAFLVAHVQPLWTSLYVSSQRIALNVNGTACTEEHFALLVPSIVVAGEGTWWGEGAGFAEGEGEERNDGEVVELHDCSAKKLMVVKLAW
jgi:hypothetical protein